jgi:3-oxoacyl-[acyl-carrier protein] reductase
MTPPGPVAFVTGASGGIGHGIVEALADAEFQVILGCGSNPAPAQKLAQELRERGVAAAAQQFDLRSEEEIREAVRASVEGFGRIDLLVNNAGVTPVVPLAEVTAGQLDEALAVDLRGPVLLTKEVVAGMVARRDGGRIVNVTSVNAFMSAPGHVAYDVSKAGLTAFTRTAAVELAPHGITVNAVAPGFIEVERTRVRESYNSAEVGRCFPVGRVGRPADIAAAVLYLASPAAGYVTGQTITVDGGLLARLPS